MSTSCLVVGLGKIGLGYDLGRNDKQFIQTHARAIFTHPAFQLVGGVDPLTDRRIAFNKEFGVPAFKSIDAAMTKIKPEVVIISSPTLLHLECVQGVFKHYCPRLILLEKPMGFGLEQSEKIVELCQNHGVDLFVNYMRRSDHGVLKIKDLIEVGEISPPLKATAWYSNGLYNNGAHIINLLSFWLGDAISTRIIRHGRKLNDSDQEPDFEVVFDRGSLIAQSGFEEFFFSIFNIQILSSSGLLTYTSSGHKIEWQSRVDDPYFLGYFGLSDTVEEIFNETQRYQYNVFEEIHKFFTGKPYNLCTGMQALKTSKI